MYRKIFINFTLMKRTALLSILLSILSFTVSADDFSLLMSRIRADRQSLPCDVSGVLDKMSPDGSFTDIDYSNRERTIWPVIAHLDNLYLLAAQYTNPDCPLYGNKDVYYKIRSGLEFWHKRKPKSANWWYNVIATPQKLGLILIQLRVGKDKIPGDLEASLTEYMRKNGKDPLDYTGANRTDVALHWLFRACLDEDEDDLRHAVDNIYSTLKYDYPEGFQPDMCFLQHGPQLYIGGYGDALLDVIPRIASYTEGTRFALPEEKVKFLADFVCGTYIPTFRRQFQAFDVMGRSLTRPNTLDKRGVLECLKYMKKIDKDNAGIYDAALLRAHGNKTADYAVNPLHKHFHVGDYTLHSYPGFHFDTRLESSRTMRNEYGNEENLKGYYLSNGATCLMVNGDEYFNIFPVWSWTRIPGTTAPQLQEVPLLPKAWKTRGTSTFAGGVSDSICGVTAYVMNDTLPGHRTEAHKAWFYFGDEVICLGSGIRSESEFPVYTTLNQCRLTSDVKVRRKDGRTIINPEAQTTYISPDWVEHNGLTYFFPAGGKVSVSAERRNGTWHDINHSQPKDTVSENVFALWIDHGKRPAGATYAYRIAPALLVVDPFRYLKTHKIRILANDTTMQAVKDEAGGLSGIVFYKPGKLQDNEFSIEADRPCAVMVRMSKQPGKTIVHVADPYQSLKDINLTRKRKGIDNQAKSLKCSFGSDNLTAGRSLRFDL